MATSPRFRITLEHDVVRLAEERSWPLWWRAEPATLTYGPSRGLTSDAEAMRSDLGRLVAEHDASRQGRVPERKVRS